MADLTAVLYIGPLLHARFVITWVLFAIVVVGIAVAFVGRDRPHHQPARPTGEAEPAQETDTPPRR